MYILIDTIIMIRKQMYAEWDAKFIIKEDVVTY